MQNYGVCLSRVLSSLTQQNARSTRKRFPSRLAGQGGVWDVDGSGLQAIEDQSIAAKLRAKVNQFNLQTAAIVFGATLLYVFVPELLF